MKDLYKVVQDVHLTEKASLLGELNNEYVFKVDRRANKIEIKQAVERLFGKKVAAVRTCNYSGKLKRQRRSDQGRTASWKKAVVRLKDGETLHLV